MASSWQLNPRSFQDVLEPVQLFGLGDENADEDGDINQQDE